MMSELPYMLNLQGKLFDLSQPKVMAIINVTPDSFYSPSRISVSDELIERVEKYLNEGASIIDIGAYSTRPSANPVSEEEEWKRLELPLKGVRKHFPDAIVSVDTFRSGIAKKAVEEFGVQIINDVSGGTLDEQMFETVAEIQAAYILMHLRGTPQTMQKLTIYDDLVADVLHFLENKSAQLVKLGVKDIIIDPGFGFAKTLEQNYELMDKLSYFKELGYPLLVGVSRKSMIYNLLDITPEESLAGTTVLNTIALLNGANILRVHDVKEAEQTIKIIQQFANNNSVCFKSE